MTGWALVITPAAAFAGAALANLAKPYLEYRLGLKRDLLLGVKKENSDLKTRVTELEASDLSKQDKIAQLQISNKNLRISKANHRLAGDRLLTKLMILGPDENWSEISSACGWPPIEPLGEDPT